ncbi:tRNA lysidine(34) synthetase TilS [Maridesulfovibrio sp. FT414]|uniref:tRNA lysidine(34) synthetase TilS n=1 Tax=Maridesulfovibrio sp. FT414 TaxID=2979469 RepID=UPI003D800435
MIEKLPRSLQELEPKQARFCLNIEKFGNSKCGSEFAARPVLVGVSGGIDSTALLVISTLLTSKSGGRVFCAHVDHGLREASIEDARFVAELCSILQIPLESVKIDVKRYAADNSIGLEEAGRILRYDFFKSCLNKYNADFLLLAHHLDDLSEDVVMRLIRGAGWPALAGMDAYDSKRKLLRPLLSTSKEDLMAFLNSFGCPWREDESNHSMDYTRNRVRHKIMPLFYEENPSFGSGILRLKNQAELDEAFWACEVDKTVSRVEDDDSGGKLIPCSILDNCHQALRMRVYKVILDSLGKGHALADSLFRLDQAYLARKSGSVVQFPGDKEVAVSKKGLLFKVIKSIDRVDGKV